MKIKSAKFIVSNQSIEKCPNVNIPEYAFIGRSNVGKSSLINMLTNNKKLAKTSSTPGKTRLINHFLIDDIWHLVDLPGYGYAKASKSEKKEFHKLITDYFTKRNQLVSAFILVDSRHEVQKIDIEFMKWLTINNIAFAIIFTKIDKTKQNGNPNDGIEFKINNYKKVLLNHWEYLPKIFLSSSVKHIGRDNILQYIEKINATVTEK